MSTTVFLIAFSRTILKKSVASRFLWCRPFSVPKGNGIISFFRSRLGQKIFPGTVVSLFFSSSLKYSALRCTFPCLPPNRNFLLIEPILYISYLSESVSCFFRCLLCQFHGTLFPLPYFKSASVQCSVWQFGTVILKNCSLNVFIGSCIHGIVRCLTQIIKPIISFYSRLPSHNLFCGAL